MKIALAQLNPIPADIKYNKNKIIETIQSINADLLVFPQNFIYGDDNFKMIEKFKFVSEQINYALNEISKIAKYPILLSLPYDKFVLIENHKINKVTTFQIKNKTFKILTELQNSNEADYLIYSKSLISRTNSEFFRNKELSEFAHNQNKNLIYINQVGATDSKVYDGLSRFINQNGETITLAKAFEEDILYNISNNVKNEYLPTTNLDSFSLNYENDLKRTYMAAKLAIKDYFSKNGFKQAVLGLSGGLDSTICAVLLADALGNKNVLGVLMPSKLSSNSSIIDANELAKNLNINYITAPIKTYHEVFNEGFENIFNEISVNWHNRYTNSFTQDNIQARSRAMILWGIANEYSATLPIATSDKSECYMGYATINGDMSGGYAPIMDITKTKLFALGHWMNKNREIKNAIPENILKKPPGAELAIDPNTGETLKAEDALMPYEFMDEVIWRIENFNQSIDNMMQNEFIYEKNNIIDKDTKKQWLEKFYKRMNSAIYKWYISPPSPIMDSYSINRNNQAITSNLNY